ncbi:MAG TPA: ATP synthase subunit I [Rhodoferax sp.]
MPVSGFDTDETDEPGFRQLSAEEAQALRAKSPPLSPWRVVVWQAVVGVLVALLAWGLTQNGVAGASAAYGAMAVVLPAALLARGLSRQRGAANASSALTGFFVWEMVKIALTVAMLAIAPRLILDLNWLALLAGFVVTMKVYWVAMWLRPGRQDSINKN